VRWKQLFADLQAQFEEQEASAERADAASRTRAEVGAVRLAERLRGAVGAPVVLTVRGAGQVGGALVEVGSDWLLLADDGGRDVLVASSALRAVAGLRRWTAAPEEEGPVRAALDLRRAMRALARDRTAVQVVLDDGSTLSGTVDRVGADYLELAEHSSDAPRRAEAVQGVRAVLIAAVTVVRTVAPGI
jgi:hypothetical protein